MTSPPEYYVPRQVLLGEHGVYIMLSDQRKYWVSLLAKAELHNDNSNLEIVQTTPTRHLVKRDV